MPSSAAGGEKDIGTTNGTNYTKVESVQSADGQTGAKHSGGTTDHAAPQVSDAVKALLGLDGKKHNYPSLLSAINDLGDEISAIDVAALREMLNFSNDQSPEKMRPIEINAVKNDVPDSLSGGSALQVQTSCKGPSKITVPLSVR